MIQTTKTQEAVCQRYAELICATLASIDALAPIPLASTPHSFSALKRSANPGPHDE